MLERDTGGAGSTVTFTVMTLPLIEAVTGTTVDVVTGAVVTGTDAVGTGSPAGIVIEDGTERTAGFVLIKLITAGPEGNG